MSIAMLTPDDPVAVAFSDRLVGLGYPTTRQASPDVELLVVRDDAHTEKVLRDNEELLLRIPALLLVEHLPSGAELMEAMALGINEVVIWPSSDEQLSVVVERNLKRGRARRTTDPALHQQMRDLERDQRAGHYIQMGMLPPNPMAIDRYRLRHKILPSLMLSGDFVDYFRITDQHFVFYIADVSGHGASSAFVTVILKNFSRRLRREYHPRMLTDPGEILVWLNREILENEIDKHVAMFIAVVDLTTDVITYANAGHFRTPCMFRESKLSCWNCRANPLDCSRACLTRARQQLWPRVITWCCCPMVS